MTTAGMLQTSNITKKWRRAPDKGRGICAKHTPSSPKLKVESHVLNIRWRRSMLYRPHSAAVTFTFVPARTAANVFTSPAALANTLHGLASRVSSPRLIGVRPKPIAIAGPSGQ
jgi:hypothetical protein